MALKLWKGVHRVPEPIDVDLVVSVNENVSLGDDLGPANFWMGVS